jgi:hypothetical protein
MITDAQQQHLNDGISRHHAIEQLHRAGNTDAKLLQGLVGLRCKKFDQEYEITYIGYSYDGYITARGKKLLVTGKFSKYPRDIGPITPGAFDI